MKHHDVRRPIGKCKGCSLNSRTSCSAGLEPFLVWSNGRCRHYGNVALLEEQLRRPGLSGAKLAYELRRQKAVAAASCISHSSRMLSYGKFANMPR